LPGQVNHAEVDVVKNLKHPFHRWPCRGALGVAGIDAA
jgi:hypothetical protein